MSGRLFGLVLAAVLTTGAVAQDGPFGGFKHDSSEDIEITADSLEVREAESIAIFSGTVEAGQGTLRLNADKVIVEYDTEQQDSETGAIRNMKAEGNVFLTNGAETATGRFAEYDVASGQMMMRGEVILTQGGNAVSGELLQIDMNTGRAQMLGGVIADGSSGRVRSIFKPSSGNSN
ncbi:MAG: lipopolysaccharide transport periplasmic protein LptA [Pseudomonadota bacterium]